MGIGPSQQADKQRARRLCKGAFVAAIERQRQSAKLPSSSAGGGGGGGRKLEVRPGQVSVAVRVRPLFPHEAERGDFCAVDTASAPPVPAGAAAGAGSEDGRAVDACVVTVHEARLPRGLGFDGELGARVPGLRPHSCAAAPYLLALPLARLPQQHRPAPLLRTPALRSTLRAGPAQREQAGPSPAGLSVLGLMPRARVQRATRGRPSTASSVPAATTTRCSRTA
jgi:hypothetical protein